MSMKDKMKARRAASIILAQEATEKAKEAVSNISGASVLEYRSKAPNLIAQPFPNEHILDDDYPIYAGYCYLFDNKVTISPLTGSCARVKKFEKVNEIRSCDMVARGLL